MRKKFTGALALIVSAAMLISGCDSTIVISDVYYDNGSNSEVSESSADKDSSELNSDDNSGDSSEQNGNESSDITDSNSDNDSDNSSLESSSDTDNNSSDSDSKEENSGNDSSSDNTKSGFSADWKLTTSWEAEGKYCGAYDVVITNNTGDNISGWTAEISVPNDFEVLNSWNGEFNVSSGMLTIKNAEYNAEIPAGGNISFGFNYSAASEFTPGEVKINSQKADNNISENSKPENSDNSTDNNSDNNSSDNSQSSQTENIKPVIKPEPVGTTAHVSTHGKLSVNGTQLVDKNGNAYQLRGMSTHGIGWFPDFVNEEAFKTLRDDWNTNVVRLAMYSGEGEGYSGDGKKTYENLVRKGIELCIKLDMYVIVDWHVLGDQSPQVMKTDALRFFEEITSEYGNYPNLIYEICNEPNGYASWESDVKPYAEEVIPIIRKNAPDSVIIVGTPTWSQDIDKAMNNPLDYDNIMYALHFYAATHTDWLRDRLKSCNANGLPVMVTEFGCCDASGNGNNDFGQSEKWLSLLDDLGISYMNWSLCNKDETASALKPNASTDGNWEDGEISESGKWLRKWFRGER